MKHPHQLPFQTEVSPPGPADVGEGGVGEGFLRPGEGASGEPT